MLPKQTKAKAGGAAANGVSKGSEESSGQNLTEKLNIDISGSYFTFCWKKWGKCWVGKKLFFKVLGRHCRNEVNVCKSSLTCVLCVCV